MSIIMATPNHNKRELAKFINRSFTYKSYNKDFE